MGLAGGSPWSWAEPDEALLGKQAGYPIGPRWSAMENRVGAWSALDKVPGLLGQFVQRGDTVSPLSKARIHQTSNTAIATSVTRLTSTWSGAVSQAC